MATLVTCPTCGDQNQEAGKYCEQCGTRITLDSNSLPPTDGANGSDKPKLVAADISNPPDAFPTLPPAEDGGADDSAAPPADASNSAPVDDTPVLAPNDPPPATPAPMDDPFGPLRFVCLENGARNDRHSFPLPVGARLLVGRTDPANGVFPDVDVTMWSARVQTPDGPLYTIHRKQCTIARDSTGQVWIQDWKDYVGDTMVSLVGTAQFRPITSLGGERPTNVEGALALEVGDRILMGQAEGMLVFLLVQET